MRSQQIWLRFFNRHRTDFSMQKLVGDCATKFMLRATPGTLPSQSKSSCGGTSRSIHSLSTLGSNKNGSMNKLILLAALLMVGGLVWLGAGRATATRTAYSLTLREANKNKILLLTVGS